MLAIQGVEELIRQAGSVSFHDAEFISIEKIGPDLHTSLRLQSPSSVDVHLIWRSVGHCEIQLRNSHDVNDLLVEQVGDTVVATIDTFAEKQGRIEASRCTLERFEFVGQSPADEDQGWLSIRFLIT